MIFYILWLLNALGQLFLCAAELDMFSANFTDAINSKQDKWIAGKNFDDNITEDFLGMLISTEILDKGEKFPFTKPKERGIIPRSFDARKEWPYCKTLRIVPDQGDCGNCWAAAMALTLSSRLCIQSRGKYDYELSMDDATRCCATWDPECVGHRHGCYGGSPNIAYKYWIKVGIVSGGFRGSEKGCRPYSDELYNFKRMYPSTPDGRPTKNIRCIKRCSNPQHRVKYKRSLVSGDSVNYLKNENPMYIQLEIMNNGPVHAFLEMYADFFNYKKGVYFHKTSKKKGWHGVVLLGWGEEDGFKYWLGCNSWGIHWGQLGGYFKILRGHGESEIESRVYGPSFGFGRRAINKTDKTTTEKTTTEKTSSSVTVQIENIIVLTFLIGFLKPKYE